MPIYEYQCTNCNHHFDLMQKITEQAIKQCPECSKNTIVKLISAAGFQLKGTGWYATDFKNNKPKPDSSDDTGKQDKSKETPVSKTTTEGENK